MKLQTIFDQLTFGELAQLSIGGATSGGIQPDRYPAVISHINLGLTALHKRFPIRENHVMVRLVPGVDSYVLASKYSELSTAGNVLVKYLVDTPQKRFKEDILKILQVIGDTGNGFSINDDHDPYSVHTPQYNILNVPTKVVEQLPDLPEIYRTSLLKVVYQANHELIKYDDCSIDPMFQEVELPITYLEPLLLFVAARLYTPTGMTNETNLGNTYAVKYEQACQDIENRGLAIDQLNQHGRFHLNGWV